MTRHPLAWLIAFTLLAHGLGLAGGFVYDDHRFVEHNEALDTATLGALLLDPATHTIDSDRDVYRPVRALAHAYDRRLWGPEPFGFHLHSLVLHVLNVVLGFLVLRRLLPETGDLPAFFGALTLGVHPLGVEAVGWISSRGDLYAVAFGLVALACAIRAPSSATSDPSVDSPGPGQLALAVVLALLATLSKESALVLPLVGLLHRRLTGSRGWAGPVALAAGVALALGLRQVALAGASPIQTAPHGGDLIAQAGWAVFGLGTMLRHLAWPMTLSVEHPQELWAAAGSPGSSAMTWLGAIAIAGALLGLARPGRRRATTAAVFLGCWALLAYLPSSSLLVTLRSLVADRYAYPVLLPAGALLGVVPGLLLSPDRLRLGSIVLALVLATVWIPLTRDRTAVFADDGALWTDVLRHHPGSVRAQLGLAAADTDPDRTRERLEQAIRQAEERSDGRLLAVALAERGFFALRQDADPEGAVRWLSASLLHLQENRGPRRPHPEEVGVAVDLAEALALVGRDDDAARVLGESLAHHAGHDPEAVARLMLQRARLAMRYAARAGTPDAWQAAEATLLEAELNAPDHPGIRALRRAWAERRLSSDDQLSPSSASPPLPPRSP